LPPRLGLFLTVMRKVKTSMDPPTGSKYVTS
ncbi:hypothetical protein CCACVL1_30315, partial [Corchorus capsularis]